MNQLIRFVQETIDRHDKSVRGFAIEIGISPSYMRHILNGEQKAGTKFFKQLSEHTGVTIDALVDMQDASIDDPPITKLYNPEFDPLLIPEVREQMRSDYLKIEDANARKRLLFWARLMGSDLYEGLDDDE